MGTRKHHSLKHNHVDDGAFILEKIKSLGLRLTKPRKAILDLLCCNHGPYTVEEIKKLTESFLRPSPDLATIYRTVATFLEIGVLRRCDFNDGMARYELDLSSHHKSHHHHIVCKSCRKTDLVQVCPLDLKISPLKLGGFSNITHSLEFFGICDGCLTPSRF